MKWHPRYKIQKKTIKNKKRMMKMGYMKIVATTILKEKEGESNVGEHSYSTWHDESALIDYDYLQERKVFVEDKVHDRLISNPDYKNLYNVTLNVKYWQIGSSIYTAENHQTKQIKKTISIESLKSDENTINTSGYIIYRNGNEGLKSYESTINTSGRIINGDDFDDLPW
jgi:hypothetical protein